MPRTEHVLRLWLVHMVFWHVSCALFALCDHKQWFSRYKLVKRDRITYLEMLPRVLFNQCFLLLPSMLAIGYYELGFAGAHRDWYLTVLHIWLFGYVHDALFYAGHAFMHTRLGYKLLSHHVHHRSNGASAAASMYMASIDFMLEIVVPFMALFLLIESDWRFELLVASVGTLSPVFEHSGYYVAMPWNVFDTRPHISHHQKRPHGSFSEGIFSSNLCDWLMGTALDESEKKAMYEVEKHQ
jgi:hypothetical protein